MIIHNGLPSFFKMVCAKLEDDQDAIKKAEQESAESGLHYKYKIYRACEDNGHGVSTIDGMPIKTFDEWLNS